VKQLLASYVRKFDKTLIYLNKALKIIDWKDFSLKTSKHHFFNKKIELLSYVISQEFIKPLNTIILKPNLNSNNLKYEKILNHC